MTTTRRALLHLAGAAAGAAALGGAAACERRVGGTRRAEPAAAAPERLVVRTNGGLAVVAEAGPVLPAGTGVLDATARRLVRATTAGDRTDVVTHDVGTGRAVAQLSVRGALQARVLTPDGFLVALATTGPRTTTTIAVAETSGERVRVTLPGNLEPEAFTSTGKGLFLLDHLPPAAPDRYRVRLLNLVDRKVYPLNTRAKQVVPAGAEEEMRGQGRQAVYDASRQLLFTLYTHQGGHLHTRDLRGARRDAPGVHAFVHTLSLTEHWAYCVDLPAPFGEHTSAGHAIALRADGGQVSVIDATSRMVAAVDPVSLEITRTARVALPRPGPAGASAGYTADGRLVVSAGNEVVVVDGPRWACPAPVRGIAVHPDGRRVYVGQDAAVTCHDLTTGQVLGRTAAPGLVSLERLSLGRT